MRLAAVALALLVLPPALAVKTQQRLASQAQFTDALSLISRQYRNPYALNAATKTAHVSLSQAESGSSGNAATNDVAGFGVLGGSEANAAGMSSDDAADAVSDSIQSLFNLGGEKPTTLTAAPALAAAPTAKALKVPVFADKTNRAAIEAHKATPAPQKVKVSHPMAKPMQTKAAGSIKPVTKQMQHIPAPAAQHAALKAAPQITAKKQQASSSMKKAVIAKPRSLATKPVKATAAHEMHKGIIAAATKPQATQKVEELEAEVSALKAKLAGASVEEVHKPVATKPVPSMPVASKLVAAKAAKTVAPPPRHPKAVLSSSAATTAKHHARPSTEARGETPRETLSAFRAVAQPRSIAATVVPSPVVAAAPLPAAVAAPKSPAVSVPDRKSVV